MSRLSLYLLAPLVLLATSLGSSAQTYTIVNHCPTSIDLHIGSTFDSTLATGASVVKTGLGPNVGHFWTSTNNGVRDNTNVATGAGFRMNPNEWFYYIVKDENHNHFNTGISITPSVPAANGFCEVITCNTGDCEGTFYGPRKPSFLYDPPILPNDPARPPPIYQCKTPGVDFTITFCPTGRWPIPVGEVLRPNLNPFKCMEVRGGVLQNGTPVQIYDCNGTGAQDWVYYRGTNQIKVKGTNFCLDSGASPANGSKMKIWQCYDNLPAQQWTVTWDSRIVRAGTSLCLDLPGGDTTNTNVIQTWTCSDFNNNQTWSKWYCVNCN